MPTDDEIIRSAKLHDSNFFSVESRDGRVRLGFNFEDEDTFIELNDVSALVVAPFLQGNIVDDVVLSDARNVSEVISGVGEGVRKNFEEYYPSKVASPHEGSRILTVSTSYGAEVLCVFSGRIEVRR